MTGTDRTRPGPYRHYKGGLYTLLCVGRHSETEEWLVTYRSEAQGDYWVRPLAMWVEDVDGVPRFRPIGPDEASGT
ncbi:DUF1653 domain-containing protein [Gluconacetobacter tumulisoli]|uniref:DUF1653 domain-containing protein n=1 Tax=Gluconacetobacter tumulisoli TaxID=1286189 RepID=A0A7W4K440_9PROT|nr:DUF1653 domain-containing protein [Gluconacetobacter tumulisoli]MBB2200024.1 DUF1653 domain-containing protein [Gluconacetobacter tumulisoli]